VAFSSSFITPQLHLQSFEKLTISNVMKNEVPQTWKIARQSLPSDIAL